MSHRTAAAFRHPAVLVALWAAAVAVMAALAGRFWIPLDDGTLAQSAERVLSGQLPHRDFSDPYTGLGAFLGAAAFKLLGVKLWSLRVPLVAAFALWLPAVWLLARRHLPPASALGATALAAVLSVPAYPAAMPGWYALFAVTWGAWFLTRALEGGGRGWLVGAGAMAGVAVLFKVVGLYFLAAALLSVAWRRAERTGAYVAVATAAVTSFLLLLGWMALPGTGASGAYHFFLPGLALCAALLARARGVPPGLGTHGLVPLLADGAALKLGFVVPLAVFLVPYALGGGLGAWLEGVFLLPARRFEAASSPPGDPWTVLPGAAAVLLAVTAARLRPRAERTLALTLAALLAVALAADDALDGAVMATLWYALRGWIPALVAAAAVFAFAARGRTVDQFSPAESALLATAGLWALVQFPYAAPAYFFYVAPLGVLATAAAVAGGVLRRGPVLGLVAGVALFLGAGYAAGGALTASEPLGGPRGGIRVPPADARLYGEVTILVRSHLEGGSLWAGPDAPEVYFLAGAPNPTPTLYEFLDRAPLTPTRLHSLLESAGVRVAVVNTRPIFSPALDPSSMELLVRTFPESRTVGPFVVRWRTP
ncbi:MAG TPA: glycosyltransferase family 39 protein [Longimicrobiales bacterium]|nr:glycosyltransferase family 39 protein [Longimicrobiales bacterium]